MSLHVTRWFTALSAVAYKVWRTFQSLASTGALLNTLAQDPLTFIHGWEFFLRRDYPNKVSVVSSCDVSPFFNINRLNMPPHASLTSLWHQILKPSRRRNGLVILFTLILINLFILCRYLTLGEGSKFLPNIFLHHSDNTSISSGVTVTQRKSSRILLVSSLFRLSKSKHSEGEYHNWLQRFLGPITTEVYFYTSLDLVPIVQSARGEGLPIIFDTTYNTTFDVPPLKNQKDWYNEMHALDREAELHSPELYSVWNAKSFFVDNAIRVMASRGKTYDYVFWNDGGSFREDSVYKDWPDINRLDEIWQEGSKLSGTKAEDLLFFPIQYPPYNAKDWKEDMGPIDTDFSEGKTFFELFPSVRADFIPVQVHFSVVPRVQWLGGHVHSTLITTTTSANASLSGKIKLSSTPSSFYSANVSSPYGRTTPKRLLQTLDLVSNP